MTVQCCLAFYYGNLTGLMGLSWHDVNCSWHCYSLRLFWDLELGFYIGTLTHEAGRLSWLPTYNCCLVTAVAKIRKMFWNCVDPQCDMPGPDLQYFAEPMDFL